jgi:hypothetical protein
VRLNTPAGQAVNVDFAYDAPAGTLRSGTLNFSPGETVKWVDPSGANAPDQPWIRLSLSNPKGATLAGITSITYSNPPLTVVFGVASNQLDLAAFSNGVPVNLSVPVSAWSAVSVDFKFEASGRVLTNGTVIFTQGQTSKQLNAPTIDPNAYDIIRVSLVNPVHAQLATPDSIYFVRSTNNTNEQHVYVGSFGGQITAAWGDGTFVLEQADEVKGPWTLASSRSPYTFAPAAQKFFRLKK